MGHNLNPLLCQPSCDPMSNLLALLLTYHCRHTEWKWWLEYCRFTQSNKYL